MYLRVGQQRPVITKKISSFISTCEATEWSEQSFQEPISHTDERRVYELSQSQSRRVEETGTSLWLTVRDAEGGEQQRQEGGAGGTGPAHG